MPTSREDTPGKIAFGDTVAVASASADRMSRTGAEFVAMARGEEIGPFIVIEEIGRGGMGIVYAAYDPRLDRKVAVKLLRPVPGSDDSRPRATRRLLREAKAMARLSHPNVVVVHEVGEASGQVYLAMEFVNGGTLRQWVNSADRSWRDLVSVFLHAGRGLCAAHDAGLVHRDFKPENILLGGSGTALQVKVTDFGLVSTTARGAAAESTDAPGLAKLMGRAPTDPQLPTVGEMTLQGTVMGTPGYIAPEVLSGGSVDARADQFAFCVALHEALVGEKPYADTSLLTPLSSEDSCDTRALPDGHAIPTWLLGVVRRGLDPNPDARYPSMHALLRALSVDPELARRRRLRAAGILTLVAALLIAAVWGLTRPRPRSATPALCQGAGRHLEGRWDSARRSTMSAAFDSVAVPYAATSFRHAAHVLDDYAQRWTTLRTRVCEDTQLHGEQSEAVMDMRMWCLDRRLDELDAVVSQLSKPLTAMSVERSGRAVEQLIAVDSCSNIDTLTSVLEIPRDAEMRGQVAALRKQLDENNALERIKGAGAARQRSATLVKRARVVSWPHTLAMALFQRAWIEESYGEHVAAEKALREAVVSAATAKDDSLTAAIFAALIRVIGFGQSRFDAAIQLRPFAEAAAARTGQSVSARSTLIRAIGMVYDAKGKFAEALTYYSESLRLARSSRDPQFNQVAEGLNNVAVMLDLLGKHAQARIRYNEVLAMEERAYGPEHPSVARALNNLGAVSQSQGDLPQALRQFRRALEIWKRAYGPKHSMVAITSLNLGVALQDQKKYNAARTAYRVSFQIWKHARGRDRLHFATTLINLGDLDEVQGRCEKALTYYRRGLATVEEVVGTEHPDNTLALVGIGSCSLRTGAIPAAVKAYERALDVRQHNSADPAELAEVQLGLSKALWQSVGDRSRAHNLARRAAKFYRSSVGRTDTNAKAFETWMAARKWAAP